MGGGFQGVWGGLWPARVDGGVRGPGKVWMRIQRDLPSSTVSEHADDDAMDAMDGRLQGAHNLNRPKGADLQPLQPYASTSLWRRV
jgi:hypothetical protein